MSLSASSPMRFGTPELFQPVHATDVLPLRESREAACLGRLQPNERFGLNTPSQTATTPPLAYRGEDALLSPSVTVRCEDE